MIVAILAYSLLGLLVGGVIWYALLMRYDEKELPTAWLVALAAIAGAVWPLALAGYFLLVKAIDWVNGE